MIVRAHLPLALATVLVLSGCGAASAATPSHSAPHHATHRTKRPAVRPASHPLADLRLAVLQANVATLPAGIGPFPGEVPLVLRVQVQNPTAQSVFLPAILFDLTAAHPPTTCAPESNVPACSNSVGADGEFPPPAPSPFPHPAFQRCGWACPVAPPATAGGYQVNWPWLDRNGHLVSALVLLVVGMLVFVQF
jgi:hypothetical protein